MRYAIATILGLVSIGVIIDAPNDPEPFPAFGGGIVGLALAIYIARRAYTRPTREGGSKPISTGTVVEPTEPADPAGFRESMRQAWADAKAETARQNTERTKQNIGRIAQFKEFTLFSNCLNSAKLGNQSLTGVSARVDQGGAQSSRSTLSRSMVPGMHGWQKQQDDRYAELVIEGPEFYWTTPLTMPFGGQFNPRDVGPARAFASRINNAARQYTARQQQQAG